MTEELFPDIKMVSKKENTLVRSNKKAPFVFRNPLFRCPHCFSKGPYKLGSVSGEINRSCLKCGFSFNIDSREAEQIREASFKEQYKKWEHSP